jgi:ADP-L-glycero-D-manno-heptose 6-epimerase
MYGLSKHLFDLWVLKNSGSKFITGFKFFNVFGPNEYHKGDMRSMINKTLPAARDEKVIKLFASHRPEYADGGQMRDFVYIKDVVEVMAYFFTHPKIGGIYNIGTGHARTWSDVARAMFAALGEEGTIEYIPMPDHLKGKYQYYTQADLRKLHATGCDHTFMRLEDSVKDYVQNYLMKDNQIL